MEMKKIKLALFGAGIRGQYKYAPYVLNFPHKAEFVSVVDNDSKSLETFMKSYNVNKNYCFDNVNKFFDSKIEADAILICTQDQLHYSMAKQALENGYHVMLEKPMAVTPYECISLNKIAKENNRLLFICHVLRYFEFFVTLKSLLENKKIGELISIQHNENVGFFHMAHSFVRGNWCNAEQSTPMILQKSCHDMDILLWLVDSKCEKICSFGSLSHFKSTNKPKDAPYRCIDNCPHEKECPYSAIKIYLMSERKKFPAYVLSRDGNVDEIVDAIQNGPYGVCVFQCENNVVDHQSTILEFENGVTAGFSMCGFTHEDERTIRIMGTKGEIRAHLRKGIIDIHNFSNGITESIQIKEPHDRVRFQMDNVMSDFINLIAENNIAKCITRSDVSIESHLMAFAAEQSRIESKIVDMKQFYIENAKEEMSMNHE